MQLALVVFFLPATGANTNTHTHTHTPHKHATTHACNDMTRSLKLKNIRTYQYLASCICQTGSWIQHGSTLICHHHATQPLCRGRAHSVSCQTGENCEGTLMHIIMMKRTLSRRAGLLARSVGLQLVRLAKHAGLLARSAGLQLVRLAKHAGLLARITGLQLVIHLTHHQMEKVMEWT